MFNLFAILLCISVSLSIYINFLSPFDYLDILFVSLILIGVWIGCLFLYAIFILIYSSTIDKSKLPEKPSKFLQALTADLAKKVLFFTNTSLKLKGMEKIPKNTRFLLISNHISSFDPICYNLAMKGYDVGFISKPENFKIPVVSNLVHGEYYLPIDRNNDREAMKTIIKAINLCKNNVCSIGLFPEGTRNKTDKPLLEFKTGGFKIAQKSSIPIVVSVIKNVKNLTYNPFVRSHIEIEIIDVIEYENLPQSTTELGDIIYNKMLDSITSK